MLRNLHPLFHEIAHAPSEQALRSRLMDGVATPFAVDRWGIYLLGDRDRLASADVVGVSDDFVDRYEAIGKSVDPLLQYLMAYHAPVHEELIFPEGGWRQSALYQRCCVEYDHAHIMTGPVVGNGDLVGTIHFARVGDAPAFTHQDVAQLGALCSHLSARLSALRAPTQPFSEGLTQQLTPRELEIAQLVATGLTNPEIGAKLWITRNSVKQALKRIFRKLNVSTRVELTARLLSGTGDVRS